MCLIYIATGMPNINLLILLKLHFLGILECTFFCAMVHIFLCKRERSGFLLKVLQIFWKIFMCSEPNEYKHIKIEGRAKLTFRYPFLFIPKP